MAGGKVLKGLSEIRTLAGSVRRKDETYTAYLRISCLEMEKARREREREAAAARIAAIDGRIREIEREKKELLTMIAEAEEAGTAAGKRQGRGDGGVRIFY